MKETLMIRLARLALSALTAGALLVSGLAGAGPAAAQGDDQPLKIGTTQVFIIRSGDTLNGRDWTVQDRIDHVQDVLPKHLANPNSRFTTKKWGERVHIYLNGDFILAVTPADAETTGYKSASTLAPIWLKGLQRGFKEAHVRQSR
jgi:hypothetical protein